MRWGRVLKAGEKVMVTNLDKRNIKDVYNVGDVFVVKEDLGGIVLTVTGEVLGKSEVNVVIEGGKYSLI